MSRSWLVVSRNMLPLFFGSADHPVIVVGGSLLWALTSIILPISPLSMASLALTNDASNRFWYPTWNLIFDFSTTFTISSVSFMLSVIGFSQNTCLPASAAAVVMSLLRKGGVARTTASIELSLRSSR